MPLSATATNTLRHRRAGATTAMRRIGIGPATSGHGIERLQARRPPRGGLHRRADSLRIREQGHSAATPPLPGRCPPA